MPLPFAPACLPFFTGELPYQSSAQALDMLRQYAGELLPYPALPRRSLVDQALVQAMLGFPGLAIDTVRSAVYINHEEAQRDLNRLALAYLENDLESAALSEEQTPGLSELLRQRHVMRNVRMVIGQLLGPITVALQLTDEHQRPLAYHPALFEAVAQHLCLRIGWIERQLHTLGATTLICLEEPFLDAVDNPFAPLDWDAITGQLMLTLSGISGYRGIIAHGAVEWPHLLDLEVDLLVIDAYQQSAMLEEAAPALRAFLEEGGALGLGMIPADEGTLQHATAVTLAGRVLELVERLQRRNLPSDLFIKQVFLAIDGDLSVLSATAAERAARLLTEVSALVRKEYKLA